MIMQDTMDYSWKNASNFYETLGKEVEKGTMTWHDADTIRDYRMTYSRALFPEKKEAIQGARPPPTTGTGRHEVLCGFSEAFM